jgi:photosystem II stability/assembly factor-like uncharacterized protein
MSAILTFCAEWSKITGASIGPSGWINTATSFDGSHQYISTDREIFYSSDTGNSWTKLNTNFSGIKPKSLIASSGGDIIGLLNNKNLQLSLNYGATWLSDVIPTGNFKDWKKVTFSFDAKYITALGFNTEIYYSLNSGVNWSTGNNTINPRNWISVAMSMDGQKQLAAVKSGSLWISSDYGQTWLDVQSPPSTAFLWTTIH